MLPDPVPLRTAFLVLGMHRSGTSALAGVLGRMGCELPQNLMPATEANARGYFESSEVFRLNDTLLASAGSSWDDWRAFDAEWYLSPQFEDHRARALEVLAGEFPGSGPIVLKDPRICRLLPFWKRVLADAGFRPLFVCIHRPPGEVGASLAHRNGWPEARGRLLWLRHVLDAEAGTRGDARVFVSYDGLLADWRRATGHIFGGLDVAPPRGLEEAAPEIEDFLSADLRRFRSGAGQGAEPASRPRLPDWLDRPLEILDRWTASGERAEDRDALDRIGAELAAATPMLETLATPLAELGGRLARETAALAEAETRRLQEVRQLGDLAAELQLQVHHKSRHIQELERHASQLEAHLEELRQQVHHRTLHEAELERHAGNLSAQIAELRQQVHHKGLHVLELEAHAGRLESRIADLETERAALLDSASWKVTHPLRSMSLALRRPKSE